MLHPKILAYCQEDVVDIRGFDRCELHEAEEGRFVLRAYPGLDCGNNIGTIHGGFLLALVEIRRPDGELAVKATVNVAVTGNNIIDL